MKTMQKNLANAEDTASIVEANLKAIAFFMSEELGRSVTLSPIMPALIDLSYDDHGRITRIGNGSGSYSGVYLKIEYDAFRKTVRLSWYGMDADFPYKDVFEKSLDAYNAKNGPFKFS
jgi:hypothetical protein